MYKRGSIGLFFRGDPTLKLYVPLEGRATNESGQAYHGTVSGAIPTPAKFGIGYYFNRAAKNKIDFGDILEGLPAQTVACWVKFDALPSSWGGTREQNLMGIVSKFWDNSNRNILLGGDSLADTIEFVLGTDTTHATVDGTKKIIVGKWMFIVATWDSISGKMNLYVDGELDSSVNCAGNTTRSNNAPLYIGGDWYNNSLSRYFQGKIAEVAIFSRALDKQEISQYYRWATSPKPKLTVTYTVPAVNNAILFSCNF